ncbi:tail fiber protein [Aquimarina algiphila]|uniref:tail fiber protein n=1 Tax=Aquimarina algiphila TaxID=2047982 RepID=UPI00232C83CC|nr:tail fiber protein [Aquimarina algiphila]
MKKNIFTIVLVMIILNINAQEVTSFLNIKRNTTASITALLGYTDSNWTGTLFWNKIGDVRIRSIDSEFHFDRNGNFGIGTAYPDKNLSIWSAESSYLNLKTNNGHEFLIGADINGGIISTMSNHDLSIRAGSNSTKMIVKANGNIGIGTTNPDMKLTVKGNIHAEEVKIDLNVPAPDYVFKSDYNLRSIEEVETFIKENSHLPEIPSAKEFEQNGVMQAQMDMNLLKKIEELTLYTIQQEKQLDKQSDEIEELKSLVKKIFDSKK